MLSFSFRSPKILSFRKYFDEPEPYLAMESEADSLVLCQVEGSIINQSKGQDKIRWSSYWECVFIMRRGTWAAQYSAGDQHRANIYERYLIRINWLISPRHSLRLGGGGGGGGGGGRIHFSVGIKAKQYLVTLLRRLSHCWNY